MIIYPSLNACTHDVRHIIPLVPREPEPSDCFVFPKKKKSENKAHIGVRLKGSFYFFRS